MNCNEAQDLFSPILDGEAAPQTRAAFEKHLAACPDCREAFARFSQVSELYTELPPVKAPSGFTTRVLHALDAIDAEGGHPMERAPGARRPRGRRRWFWGPRTFAFAAAAMLVAGLGIVLLVSLPETDRTMLSKAGLAGESSAAGKLGAPQRRGMPLDTHQAGPEKRAGNMGVLEDRAENAGPPPGPPAAAPPETKLQAEIAPAPAPAPDAVETPPARHPMPQAASPPAPPPQPKLSPSEQRAAEAAGAPRPAPEETADAGTEAPEEAAEEEMRFGRSLERAQPKTERLREQQAEPVPGEGLPRAVVAGRAFVREGQVWKQDDYAGEPLYRLSRESTFYRKLVAEHPAVRQFAALGPTVIFEAHGRWYRLTRETPDSTATP